MSWTLPPERDGWPRRTGAYRSPWFFMPRQIAALHPGPNVLKPHRINPWVVIRRWWKMPSQVHHSSAADALPGIRIYHRNVRRELACSCDEPCIAYLCKACQWWQPNCYGGHPDPRCDTCVAADIRGITYDRPARVPVPLEIRRAAIAILAEGGGMRAAATKLHVSPQLAADLMAPNGFITPQVLARVQATLASLGKAAGSAAGK